MPGEHANGDAVIVRHEQDASLIAVVDGLGHGEKASVVAKRATEVLQSVSLASSIETTMRALDDALRGSRGAAATVCIVRGHELEGCGVGNVELRTVRAEVPVVLSPGILGGRVRNMRCFRGKLRAGSRLLMFSDGVSGRFALGDFDGTPPEQVCERLLSEWSRGQDDSSVLIADLGDRR